VGSDTAQIAARSGQNIANPYKLNLHGPFCLDSLWEKQCTVVMISSLMILSVIILSVMTVRDDSVKLGI
jgi:hypothetical protein